MFNYKGCKVPEIYLKNLLNIIFEYTSRFNLFYTNISLKYLRNTFNLSLSNYAIKLNLWLQIIEQYKLWMSHESEIEAPLKVKITSDTPLIY